MATKPSDFAAGFADVVGVLFPGAALAYFLGPRALALATALKLPVIVDGAAQWVAFTVASYFLGHVVFLLGAYLDRFYDPLREWRRPRGKDALYQPAAQVRDGALADRSDALNVYKFAKAYLGLRYPNAAIDVERTEAESKFFRSGVVLLVIFLCLFWTNLSVAVRLIGFLMIGLGFSRYVERRWKSNQMAFAFVVVDLATTARQPPPAA